MAAVRASALERQVRHSAQKHQHILTTDASDLGWRAWWHKVGSRQRKEDETCGFFSRRENKNSSNWRELTAVSLIKPDFAHPVAAGPSAQPPGCGPITKGPALHSWGHIPRLKRALD